MVAEDGLNYGQKIMAPAKGGWMIGGLFDHLRSKLNWLALSVVKVGCGRALPGGEPKDKYKVQEVMNERGVR